MTKKILKSIYLSSLKVIGNKGLGRLPIIKQINRKILKTIKSSSEPVFVNGFKIYLDEHDSLGLSLGTGFEKFETRVMENNIKKGEVVIDCGANIGYYSLLFSKLVGESGKVFAFEPDPTNFSLLQKNLKVNNITNVTALNLAVSDKKCEGILFLDKYYAGHHRMYSEGKNDKGKIKINRVKLDDYFKGKEKIDFIKMDIEGSEGKAINGALNLIHKNKNIKLVLEYFPEALKSCGTEPKELLKILSEQGFKIKEINEKVYELTPISQLALLSEEHFIRLGHQATNLFFSRNQRIHPMLQ